MEYIDYSLLSLEWGRLSCVETKKWYENRIEAFKAFNSVAMTRDGFSPPFDYSMLFGTSAWIDYPILASPIWSHQ